MLNPDDYEPTEAEEWRAAEAHLDKIYKEEQAKLLSSFAINKTLKENKMQLETTKIAAQSILMSDAVVTQDARSIVPYDTTGEQEKVSAMVGASEERFITPEQVAAFKSAKAALGGDEVVVDSLSEAVAATATASTIKPPTKKQLKQMKHQKKSLQGYMRKAQRQAQTQHIMNKLYAHSIRTPQQARQIHAAQKAKQELIDLLGVRQADAFFAAKPGTKCHDFFPKATIEANPTLMTDLQGQSRTLEQVYEYFIYKHYMILTKEAGEIQDLDLNTSEDWANTKVADYVPFEGADVEAKPEETEAKFDQQAQGDVVEEVAAKAA